MKDLLLQLRQKILEIARKEYSGTIGPQQAQAMRRQLLLDTKTAKKIKWSDQKEKIDGIKAGIRKQYEEQRDKLLPVTDHDFILATYKETQATRQLHLMRDKELSSLISDIKTNPDKFQIIRNYVELVFTEGLSRGTGRIPGTSDTIDFVHAVHEAQDVLAIHHFDSPWENDPAWQKTEEQERRLHNDQQDDRILLLHNGQEVIFNLADEVNYNPSVEEIRGTGERIWSESDRRAGLKPPSVKPIIFAMGDSDAEVQTNLAEELKRYEGVDTV